MLFSLVVYRAHSRFTHCLMTQACQCHLASSESFLRVDHRSAWSEYMWCPVLTCSLRIQTAWCVSYMKLQLISHVALILCTAYHNCEKDEYFQHYLFIHSPFSATRTLRLCWGGKQWMIEITTNLTPSILCLEGEMLLRCVVFKKIFFWYLIILQWKLKHFKYFSPGCLSYPASCLKTRIWRFLCMTMTSWAEMKKWVRQSSIWKTGFSLVSGLAVACHRLTVCKYVL